MLSDLKIGFIGYGKMGGAILHGLKSHVKNLYAYGPNKEKIPADIYKDFDELCKICDIIFLATKPQFILESIKKSIDNIDKNKVLISIAANVKLEDMIEAVEGRAPIIRSMPNLPASIGKGVFALCLNDPLLSDEQKKNAEEIFRLLGSVYILKEEEFEAFTGVAGCGPGFIFHLMEGFYQAAVTLGFSHKDARELTVQTFLGSVELAANEKISFYDLKQQVCSPKGVTIQGVNHLEAEAVKASIAEAIILAAKKS